jgi:hypothetical protein
MKQYDPKVTVLKCYTRSGAIFVCLAENADRVKLSLLPNVERIEGSEMLREDFNAIDATQAATDFFAGTVRVERALNSDLEVDDLHLKQ